MAETTIEWTRGPRGELGYTFNGWIGCEKISPGCLNCYAAAQDKFRRWTPEGWGGPRKRTSEANWRKPKAWNDAAAAAGERRKVFCSSLADVFDNQVPKEWRVDLFSLIHRTPHLDWLLLTKRIGNAHGMVAETLIENDLHGGPEQWREWPWPNVWLGATVVNQEEADRDIPKLLATPARVRFLSMEPLLGPVDLGLCDCDHGSRPGPEGVGGVACGKCGGAGGRLVDWVIAGGESGHGARPMHPDWARSLRDQCASAGVPFMFKQWGEWAADECQGPDVWRHLEVRRARLVDGEWRFEAPDSGWPDDINLLYRLGKKAAGRLLDGRTHDEFPA